MLIRNLAKYDKLTKYTVLIFVLLSFWWVYIFISGTRDGLQNHIFGFVYGGYSLWGALLGVYVAKKWGGLKSLMGRAIIFLSCGLFLQAFGQYSFWYYNYVLKIELPYPSVPDIGYFGTIPFYILAVLYFARVSGVTVSLKSYINKLQAIVIPIIILGIGYFLFLQNYEFVNTPPLQIFFDFGYPLGQAIYISISILTYSLCRTILGGMMKSKILFLMLAFFAQFLADYIFIYFQALYFPASFIDYFYLTAYAMMTLAIIRFNSIYKKLNEGGQ